MATPPTVITYKNAYASIAAGTATRALTQISVTTGDTVAVIISGEDYASVGTFTLAKTAGTSVIGTITSRQSPGTSNHCSLQLFTFPVTTGGTLTLTATRSVTASLRYLTAMTYVATSCGGVGVTGATTTSTTTITASLAATANSYIGVYAADWNATGGATTTLTPAGGVVDVHEVDGVQDQTTGGQRYSSRAGHWANSSAGTTPYGVTVPTSAGYNLVAFELLAAVGPIGPTATVIVGTVTFGYAGVVQNATVTAAIITTATTAPARALSTSSDITAEPISATTTVLSANFWSFTDPTDVDDTPTEYTVVVDEAITEYVGVQDEHDQYWVAYGEELTDTDALADDISESATFTSPQPDAILTSTTVAAPTVDTTVDTIPTALVTHSTVAAPSVLQDQNITPSIVAAVGTLPPVQVRQDRTIAVSGRVSAAATVPALSPSVGSALPAAAILGRSTVAPPTVRRDAEPTATPITPPAANLPAVTITAITEGNPTPAVITTATVVPFPGVSAGVTATAVQTTATFGTAAASASSTTIPASISPAVGSRIPASIITAVRTIDIAAATITTATTVIAVSLQLGQTIDPAVIAAASTIVEPAPTAGSEATTQPIIGTATAASLNVTQDIDIPAEPLTTAVGGLQPTLQTGTTIGPDAVAATATIAELTVETEVSQTITATALTATATVVQPEDITYAADLPATALAAHAHIPTQRVTTVPDHPPVINPTRTRNTNPLSHLRVINGAGAVHVPASAVYARLTY